MKRRLLKLALGLCLAACVLPGTANAAETDITIDATTFPDTNFRSYVKTNFDTDSDGALSAEEILKVKSISCKSKTIKDLAGIEFFTAIESLDCSYNRLTELDVSQNTALTSLNCYSNQLVTLDLSGNTELVNLNCRSNQLTNLDVRQNAALANLECGSNALETLDVSNNMELTYLSCSSNQLTSLDVSKNTKLESLYCSNNLLTDLDVRQNAALANLACSSNALKTLDVSENIALTYLSCSSNQLTTLDVSKNVALTSLNCYSSQLTDLDVSKNTKLESLYCSNNLLTNLDVSQNTELTSLDCNSNCLTNLDLSNNKKLNKLYCGKNQLITVDLSNNTALTYLSCSSNRLTTLDVSENTALETLYCSYNRLTSLDLSNNDALTFFSCADNCYDFAVNEDRQIDLSTLPGAFDPTKITTLSYCRRNGNILTFVEGRSTILYSYKTGNAAGYSTVDFILTCDIPDGNGVAIDVENFPDSKFRSCVKEKDINKDGILSAEEIELVTEISCAQSSISTLKGIEYFKELKELTCWGNNLTELDLSQNTELQQLSCYKNKLTELDVSHLSELYRLDCGQNALRKLDLSKNTVLMRLSCQYNALTELDLSNNTALTKIYYGYNQLTSLDVNNVKYSSITDYISGDNNVYMVKGTSERTFDLSSLPGKFDVSKMKPGTGGTVSGTILTFNENSDTYQYYYIVRNSNAWVKQFTIKLHTHTKYGSWESNGDGTHTKTCTTSDCGFTETETCMGGMAKCNAKAICSVCKGEYGALNTINHAGDNIWTIDKTTHMQQWDCCEKISVAEAAHIWKNGTCTVCAYVCEHEGGTTTCVNKADCEICGEAYGEVDSDNHSGEIAWIQTATTHAKGYTCCGVTTGDVEKHKWNDGICAECGYVCKHTGGTATCTEQATCTICGEKYGDVDPTNHIGGTEVKDAEAATCTETGYTGDTYCKNCKAKISDGSEIEALGHEESETYKYDKTSHWKICLREACDVIFDVAKHTGGVATVDKPAECEICGQPYGKCLPGFATILGTSVTGKPSREITVDMNLVANTGLASMLVELDYDKNVFEFVNAENGEVFSDESFTGTQEGSETQVLSWINGTSKENITATGKLATLKFKIKDGAPEGNYEISFKCSSEKYEAIDAEMNAVNVTANPAEVTVVNFYYGDVDGNDSVDSSDALYLRRYLAKWNGYTINEEAADLDSDEAVTLRDITILQRHIAGWTGYATLPVTDATLPVA